MLSITSPTSEKENEKGVTKGVVRQPLKLLTGHRLSAATQTHNLQLEVLDLAVPASQGAN